MINESIPVNIITGLRYKFYLQWVDGYINQAGNFNGERVFVYGNLPNYNNWIIVTGTIYRIDCSIGIHHVYIKDVIINDIGI